MGARHLPGRTNRRCSRWTVAQGSEPQGPPKPDTNGPRRWLRLRREVWNVGIGSDFRSSRPTCFSIASAEVWLAANEGKRRVAHALSNEPSTSLTIFSMHAALHGRALTLRLSPSRGTASDRFLTRTRAGWPSHSLGLNSFRHLHGDGVPSVSPYLAAGMGSGTLLLTAGSCRR